MKTLLRVAIVAGLLATGYLLGDLAHPREAIAQGEQQNKHWILQPAKESAHFDGYLYDPETGEVFMLETRHKVKVAETK
jgi:hypothetical protein